MAYRFLTSPCMLKASSTSPNIWRCQRKMVWLAKSWFALAVVVLANFPRFPRAYAGNTTCASSQLDWYTNYVGESPCDTYQRLRRICNPDYEVQNLRPDAPGDQCDDQVWSCCCNTVAFQLSMLCMNCQYDPAAVQNKNAAVGTYTIYRGSCGAGNNHSCVVTFSPCCVCCLQLFSRLLADIQSAVCNENIRLDNFLYGGWDTGDWYYIWTRDNATRDHAASNNNTFTHCPNQVSSSSITLSTGVTSTSYITATLASMSLTTSDTSSPTAGKDSSGAAAGGNHVGAIVGGCLGAVAGILLLGGLFMFWRRMRRNHSRVHRVQSYHRSEPGQMMSSVLPSPSHHGSDPSQMMSSVLPSSSIGAFDTHSNSLRPTDNSLHHEDAGLLELCRSASGRLPPAYRSWDDREPIDSPRTDTQDAGPEVYHTTSEGRPERNLPSTPTGTYLSDSYLSNTPLAPLRNTPAKMD
ncbi:hypothetical protein OH76DRAFT_556039 [Lentinus brumalis]|uniref:Mid2 domain-containing protein n=1 Tax=Lentinus brumalis TaxID=2498619 RepID=A0A371D996_9APHY|nr:hypothetical protein OH76DRAFT_556039 [Polyporus brumalis]